MSGSFSSPIPSLPPAGTSSLPPGEECIIDVLLGPACFSAWVCLPSCSLAERDRLSFTTTRSTSESKVSTAPTTMPRIGEIGSSPSDAATETHGLVPLKRNRWITPKLKGRKEQGQLARWRKWRACDVGKAKEGLENELWCKWSNGRVGEWAVM